MIRAGLDAAAGEVQRRLQEFYDSGRMVHGRLIVSPVLLLGSGFEADVFAFSLAGEGARAGEDLVLRVLAGEGAAAKAAREYAAMGGLREAGYPVPRVIHLECDRSSFERPFVIMERIHGVPLDWSASAEWRPELQALHCRLMAELHALEGRDVLPDAVLAASPEPSGFVDHELAMLSTLLGRLEGREPPSLRGALAWLGERRSRVRCERLGVIHGDFHRNNVLVRADGAPFVIDWSNVRLADYRTDLGWVRVLTRVDAQPDGGEAELRLYERLAGREVAMIDYFEVIACTRLLSSTLISLRFGAARQGMRPGAEALMRRDDGFMRDVAGMLQKRTEIEMPDLEDALAALLG
jgi:aminoglycoside phosphotransferase (APT) family kinase protein